MGLEFFKRPKLKRIVDDVPSPVAAVLSPSPVALEDKPASPTVEGGQKDFFAPVKVDSYVVLYLRDTRDGDLHPVDPKVVYQNGLKHFQISDWLYYREKYFCFRYGIDLCGHGPLIPDGLWVDGIPAKDIRPLAHFFDQLFASKYKIVIKTKF